MPSPLRAALLALAGGGIVLAAGPVRAEAPRFQAIYKAETRQFCLRDPGTYRRSDATPPPECRTAAEWEGLGLTVHLRPRAPVAVDVPAQP